MLIVLNVFGELERVLADLYPYRYPLTMALVLVTFGAMALAVRAGLHLHLHRYRLASTFVGAALLAVAVIVGNYLLSPLWERSFLEEANPIEAATAASPAPHDGAVTDARPVEASRSGRGQFMGADDFHFARGDALLIETSPGLYVLRFENFSVRNGPDLYVYLSTGPTGRVDERLNLGRLKATDGAFNYEVPASLDVSKVKSVLVWCRQFDVLFGSAPIQAM